MAVTIKTELTMESVLDFGKYKGRSGVEVWEAGDAKYIAWLYRHGIKLFSPELAESIEKWGKQYPKLWKTAGVGASPTRIPQRSKEESENLRKKAAEIIKDTNTNPHAGLSPARLEMWGCWG